MKETLLRLARLLYNRDGWERSKVLERKEGGFWVLSAFSDFELLEMIKVRDGNRDVARCMLKAALDAALDSAPAPQRPRGSSRRSSRAATATRPAR